MQFAFSSHIGLFRNRQEDAYGNVDGGFFVVADGLGGHPAGEKAAHLAVDKALSSYQRAREARISPYQTIVEVFKSANQKIVEEAKNDPGKSGMSTTMVTLYVCSNKWWVGNIGDSRGYFFSNGKLRQVTEDHKNSFGLITRAVGLEVDSTPDIFAGEAKNDDLLLLATDGLFDMANDDRIEKVLAGKARVQQKADKLVQMALEAGGGDNVTVCLIRIMNHEL